MPRLALLTVFFALLTLTAACADSDPARGTLRLHSPTADSVIYSPALYLSGSSEGVGLPVIAELRAEDDGALLASVRVEAAQATDSAGWALEWVHGYAGDPLRAALTLRPDPAALPADADDSAAAPYLSVPLTLAAALHRPEGAYIDVLTPGVGDPIGGDQVQVSGRASGLVDAAFTLTLSSADGQTLAQAEVTLPSPYPQDDQPWQTTLSLGENTPPGSALITVESASTAPQTIPVDITGAAG